MSTSHSQHSRNSAYQLLFFVPDWQHRSRFAVGAIIYHDGEKLIEQASLLPDSDCLGGRRPAMLLHHTMERLGSLNLEGDISRQLGNHFHLDDPVSLPSSIRKPAMWVRNNILPQCSAESSLVVHRSSPRTQVGYEFFQSWKVDHYVDKQFRLSKLSKLIDAPVADLSLKSIAHWSYGNHKLLCMEPVLPDRYLKQTIEEIGPKLLGYQTAFSLYADKIEPEFVAYILPGGSELERSEAGARLEGYEALGIRTVDIQHIDQAEDLIQQIKDIGSARTFGEIVH